MTIVKHLPESEYKVMEAIWKCDPPVTVNDVLKLLNDRNWKAQTCFTLMHRLVSRNFLCKEKKGRDVVFYPIVNREEYLKFEATKFLDLYHGNSLTSFVVSFCDNQNISENQMKKIIKIIEGREE